MLQLANCFVRYSKYSVNFYAQKEKKKRENEKRFCINYGQYKEKESKSKKETKRNRIQKEKLKKNMSN